MDLFQTTSRNVTTEFSNEDSSNQAGEAVSVIVFLKLGFILIFDAWNLEFYYFIELDDETAGTFTLF